MGKQTKVKKPDNLGKGKVTPVQVAYIVDQYLVDNNFTQTSSTFRTEASTLISKTQVRQAPKSLLSLGAILDEYICLKEQKVILDQEKCVLDQEKCRVETLLQGMKNVMNDYNSNGGGSISPPSSISPISTQSMALLPRSNPTNSNGSPSPSPSPAGYPMNRTTTMNSAPWFSNTTMYSTPVTDIPSRNKRKGSKLVPDVPQTTSKRTCTQMPTKESPLTGINKLPLQANNTTTSTQQTVQPHYPNSCSLEGSSSVAKSLFKESPTAAKTNSPGPTTPPQAFNTQANLSVSPLEMTSSLVNSTNNTTSPQEITPTNCPTICPEKVTVSPSKRVAYYSIERNHYISSSSPIKTPSKRLVKRDHVKGRLDFDASNVPIGLENPIISDISTPGTSGEADIFDMDIPNFDIFGADFSLSELLVDIDFGCEGTEPTPDHSPEFVSGLNHDFGDTMPEPNQTLTELSSSVSEVLCEKNMNIEGQDSLASVKSITKCIRILSPAKNRRNPSQENHLTSRD